MIDIAYVNQKFFSISKPSAQKHWELEHKNITLHTQRKDPGDLIKKRRPTESKETYDYRIKNFEHITHGVFNRAIETLQEILTENNASLHAPDDLMAYTSSIKVGTLNLWQWFNSKVARRMINDPNGLLVWWPKGEGLVNETERVEVEPLLVSSKRIRHKSDDFISWKSDEINRLNLGNGSSYDGEIFYLADDTNFYKYTQIEAGGVNKYQLTIWYSHQMGRIPFVELGGDEISVDGDNKEIHFYTSFLAGAVPFANEALKNYSDHQASVIETAHAIREMEQMECTHKGCDGGKLKEIGKPIEEWETCPSCKGTGQAPPIGPYGTIYRPKKKVLGGEEYSKNSALVIHERNPVGLEYQEKHWRNWLLDTEKALNLLRVEDSQSGVAKEIDKEGKKAMIDKIGFNFYNNIVKTSLELISNLRFRNREHGITLVLPPSLRPKTEKELAEELAMLKEKGAPDFVILSATEKLIKKRYASDRVILKSAEYLLYKDSLFPYSPSEKSDLIANGSATLLKGQISLEAPSIIRKIINEVSEPRFVDMSFSDIDKKFDKEIESIIIQEGAIQAFGNVSGESINDDPKAKLRATVGGIQGIIEINQNVAAGVMSEKSAEQLLIELYGFAPEVAAKLIEPKPSNQIDEGLTTS